MKHLKTLGAATLAAMALIALGGASSAQATVLCTTTATPCGSSWHVATVHSVLDVGITFHLVIGSIKLTCSSTNHHVITPTGSSTTTMGGETKTSGLTWSSCTSTTHTLAGGTYEYHHIAGTHNATVTAKGFEVTSVVSGVSCVYGAGTGVDFGLLTGGNAPKIHVKASTVKVSGSFLCPATATLEGTYAINSPSAVYAEPS